MRLSLTRNNSTPTTARELAKRFHVHWKIGIGSGTHLNPPPHRPDTGSTHPRASPLPPTPPNPRDSPPVSDPTASHNVTPRPSQDPDKGTAVSAPATPKP